MNRNKKLLIVIFVVLLVGGVAAWQLTKKDSNTKTNANTSSNTSQNTSGTNDFSPLATSGSSFAATITTTAGGNSSSAKMEFDKKTGAVRYTSSAAGQNLVMIYTKDAYYICQTPDTCIKYTLGGTNTPSFDPSSYEYTDDKLAGYRSGANYQGKQDCAAGTCDVWKVSTGSYESSIFVDTKTKRISQVEATTAAGSSKIVYEYQDVSVIVPTNATEAPKL